MVLCDQRLALIVVVVVMASVVVVEVLLLLLVVALMSVVLGSGVVVVSGAAVGRRGGSFTSRRCWRASEAGRDTERGATVGAGAGAGCIVDKVMAVYSHTLRPGRWAMRRGQRGWQAWRPMQPVAVERSRVRSVGEVRSNV